MNKPLFILTLVSLATTSLPAQTEFNGTPGTDLLDPANWSNGLPAPGNDGTIGVDGSVDSDSVLDNWGNVTIHSGATVDRTTGNSITLDNETSITVANGTLTTEAGSGNGKSNLNLNASTSIVMTSPDSVLAAQNNIAAKDGGTLTMNAGALTIDGQKLNTDGVVNLVGGAASINSLFDGGTDGIVNLTDTQITVPVPLEDAGTLTVFKAVDPWTFNFISGGSGSITIVGRDDTDEIATLISGGTFFTIDGVADANPASYSLTYDGNDTVFSLSSGTPEPPIRITDIEYNSTTDEISLWWDATSGATYTVNWSPDLIDFSGVVSSTVGDTQTQPYTFASPSPNADKLFFRASEN